MWSAVASKKCGPRLTAFGELGRRLAGWQPGPIEPAVYLAYIAAYPTPSYSGTRTEVIFGSPCFYATYIVLVSPFVCFLLKWSHLPPSSQTSSFAAYTFERRWTHVGPNAERKTGDKTQHRYYTTRNAVRQSDGLAVPKFLLLLVLELREKGYTS